MRRWAQHCLELVFQMISEKSRGLDGRSMKILQSYFFWGECFHVHSLSTPVMGYVMLCVLNVWFLSLKATLPRTKSLERPQGLDPSQCSASFSHDNQAVVSSGCKFTILNLEGILWWCEIWKTLATPPNVICTGNSWVNTIQDRRFPEVVSPVVSI